MSNANIELIKSMYAMYARGDIDSIVAGFAPDADWHTGGRQEDFPAFGARKGKAEVLDFFRTVSEALDFDEFVPLEFYADKDKVFVLGQYTVRMKKDGRRAASDWVHIFTIRDGKVTAFREHLDTAAVAAAYRG